MPVPLTSSLRLLNFPELVFSSEGTRAHRQATGLQTFSLFSALSPSANPTGFAWGLGPYASLPVSTDQDLAASQWQFGAGGIVSWRNQNFLTSVLVKSGWTVAGVGEEAGSLQVQYNLQHFFGDGYQVGLGRPTIEYTWRRDGTGTWTIPVGVDIAKVFHLGRLPVKIMLEYDFTVLNENHWEPEHTFRLTFIPVITSPIREPIFE